MPRMEYRTTKQIDADRLDAEIFGLAGRLESAGYDDAAQHVLRARYYVRKDMHKKDLEETQ